MKLIEARIAFTECLGELLDYATKERGFDLIIDETKRTQQSATWNATHCRVMVNGKRCERLKPDPVHADHAFKAIGIARSVHISGLAADLYIIEDDQICNDRAEYAVLGDFWKGLHELSRWGGDFKGFADLGHFSFEWEGRS